MMLAILLASTVALSSVGNILESSKEEWVVLQMKELIKTIQVFHVVNGRYPTEEEGLNALTASSDKKKPILEKMPVDPWGMPYKYVRKDAKHTVSLTLVSSGPDKKMGTSDDVVESVELSNK